MGNVAGRGAVHRADGVGGGSGDGDPGDGITLPPTLATTFLGCRQAAAWELARKHKRAWGHLIEGWEAIGASSAADDALSTPDMGDLITRKGLAHEKHILDALADAHGTADGESRGVHVVFDGQPQPKRRARDLEDTYRAMDRGEPIVHQATLEWRPAGASRPWLGYADFLRRVEVPCESWRWSYEPWDAKLTTRPKPSHLLQLCLYAEMLDQTQGGAPERIGLMLGIGAADGDFGSPDERDGALVEIGDHYRTASFPLSDFRYYARRVAGRVGEFAFGMPQCDLAAEPNSMCDQCHWSERCDVAWREADHLRLVAGMTGAQARQLFDAGVTTRAALAALAPDDKVTGWAKGWKRDRNDDARVRIGDETLERLAHQAAVQVRTRPGTTVAEEPPTPATELLPIERDDDGDPLRRGLARLPAPDAGDVWFDFEGDPLEAPSLEYLNGVLVRADALRDDTREGFEPVPGHEGLRFRAFWAPDRTGEREAFGAFMLWWERHSAHHPAAHLYHYAHYEKTTLRRLASFHALHEGIVDDLLREERLVDLYQVVREGVRVGAESYSIKKLEPLYMDARVTDTTGGADSVAMFHAWRDRDEVAGKSGDALRADIVAYNRDDCVSTVLLHEWLLERAAGAGLVPGANRADPADEETDEERERRENRETAEAEAHALEERILGDVAEDDPEWRVRRLAADLVDFHRREAKPEWWAYFDRQEAEVEELIEDAECLGGLVRDPDRTLKVVLTPKGKPSVYRLHSFKLPPQASKMREGDSPCLAHNGEGAGTIESYDRQAGTLVLKRSSNKDPLPDALSLIPGKPIAKGTVEDATRAVCEDMATGGKRFPHIARLLRREPPRIRGRKAGAPVVSDDARPKVRLDETIEAVRDLDRSWLAIQGPPGAGKTFTLARVIDRLIRDGKRVGVTSNSHKAIENVLNAVGALWEDDGVPTQAKHRALKIGPAGGDYAYPPREDLKENERPIIDYRASAKDMSCDTVLMGGTAWAMTHEDCPPLDVLVVDEAGQVSLGMLVASATAAKSIVLVGDQMQLSQPLQGSHPRESGMSCLEYVLEEHAVVPPERGVFLGTTFRMHPELTRFVSDAVYGGTLVSSTTPEHDISHQALVPAKGVHPAIKPHGLSFVETPHEGCSQESEAEAEVVAGLLADLVGSRVVDRRGKKRLMTLDDVLVVAPYNMQVNLLRDRLPAGARVGTVDKFQGQEAEAVIVSMATSDAEHMPRDASFLLSQNRLNVAISRARCLALIVASPGLLDLNARTVKEMRLANLLCWAAETGRVDR